MYNNGDQEAKVEKTENSTKYKNPGAIRIDALRPPSHSWEDAYSAVTGTFLMHKLIFEALSPYNSKQLGNNKPYVPPSLDYLKMVVKRKPKAMSQITFDNMLFAVRRFAEEHKTNKQLAYPDPVTLHSAHFPEGTFSISEIRVEEWLKIVGVRPYLPSSVHKFSFTCIDQPIYAENYRPDNHKYIILRPKLSKLGVPMLANWEMLFFKKNHGFFLDRVDAEINPRYAGLAISRGRSR